MAFLPEFKETYDRVKFLLLRYKEYRDDDERLVAHFWHEEVQNITDDPSGERMHTDFMNGTQFLKLVASRKVTAADEITRARRRVQEKCEETRGQRWMTRHHKQYPKIAEIRKSG